MIQCTFHKPNLLDNPLTQDKQIWILFFCMNNLEKTEYLLERDVEPKLPENT